MIRTARAFVVCFAAFTAATAAQAAPLVVTDMVDVAAYQGGADAGAYSGVNFESREAGGRHWGDEIATGAQRFDTTQLTVNRDNGLNKLTITLRTMFDGTGPAAYADLFLDIATPGMDEFGYAIALGAQSQPRGVYSTIHSNTAQELWVEDGDVYGAYAQLKPAAAGYDPDMAVFQYVRADTGVALGGYDVVTSRLDAGGGFYDLLVEITSVSGLGLFDAFDLFWATADSGADSIWGAFVTVPAPAAASLLGLGLVVLVLRRRKA